MTSVLVRDVPDDVHRALQEKAARRGQSLQQYLSVELKQLAEQPSLEDVLSDIEARRDQGDPGRVEPADAVRLLGEARAER